MLWFDRHRRLRAQLSVYIDGELDAAAAARLEVHLEECRRCRRELDELRATVAVLRELPEAEAPRSFVLTPGRAAAPRRVAPAPAPLAFGVRIAAAGVAAALAAVVVVDVGDFGGNGAMDDAPGGAFMTQMADREREGLEEARTADGAEAGEGEDASSAARPATGGAPDASEPKPDDADMDLPLPDAAGTPAAEDAGATAMSETDDAAETPAAPPDEPKQLYSSGTPDVAPDEAEAPADARDEGEAAAGAPDGDGIDALTAAEIGLAAVLVVLVAGSFVLAFARRER